MPRPAPNQLLRFIASIPIIVLLTAQSPLAQQKPAPPSPQSQPQLEDRVKDLEARANAAEQKAALAAMEKDYITRTQKQYETYYQSAFNTQVWVLSITGFTLTTLFFLAGRFGFNIFDRKIDSALKDATTQLRTEFAERLANETNALQEAHASELKTLEEGLTKRITEQVQDLRTLSKFQHNFAQALTLAADQRYADARILYRAALKVYSFGKARQVIPKNSGVACARNLFLQFKKDDEASSVEKAKQELTQAFYDDLEDELVLAAARLAWLVPLVEERKRATSPADAVDQI